MNRVFEKRGVLMNTTIIIKIISDLGTVKSYELIDRAFDQFEHVVKKFSRFDPNSELSRLNSNEGKETKVTREFFDLITQALDVAKLSQGSYDPTIIDLLETYGYDRKKDFSKLDDEKKLKSELQSVMKKRASWKQIKMDKEKSTITLKKNQGLDLGAIGKGYAIELAAKVLKPVKNYLVNAGGDLYAAGVSEEGKLWRSGLTMPDSVENIFGVIEIDKMSLACSGSWANKFKNFHHLINPKTGEPMQGVDLAYVYHISPTLADAYATMLYLQGDEGLKILEENNIGGLIVKNNKVITNKFFPEIFFK